MFLKTARLPLTGSFVGLISCFSPASTHSGTHCDSVESGSPTTLIVSLSLIFSSSLSLTFSFSLSFSLSSRNIRHLQLLSSIYPQGRRLAAQSDKFEG